MNYSVKKYLAELAQQDLANSDISKVSEHVFSVVPQIPLTPKMMKRITGDLKNVIALHVTTLRHIPNLKKLGSTSKGLSTFTKFPEPGRLDFVLGVFTDRDFTGEVEKLHLKFPCILVLEGSAITHLAQDSFTYVDRSGRRWLDMKELFPRGSDKDKRSNFHSDITKEQDKIIKKHRKEIEHDLPMKNIAWTVLPKLSGKLKSIIIKEYIDAIEKVLTKHYKNIDMLSVDSTGVGSYNEVILSNFKIKKIYFGNTSLSADQIGELSPVDIDITKEKYSKYAPIEWVGRDWKKVLTHLK